MRQLKSRYDDTTAILYGIGRKRPCARDGTFYNRISKKLVLRLENSQNAVFNYSRNEYIKSYEKKINRFIITYTYMKQKTQIHNGCVCVCLVRANYNYNIVIPYNYSM